MRCGCGSRRRSGSTLLLTLLLMFASFAVLAFAVDLGYLLVVSAELQRSADSAAIASAGVLMENSPLGGGDALVASTGATSSARQYVALNKVGNVSASLAASDISIGYLQNPSDRSQSLDSGTDPNCFNAVRVRVRRTAQNDGNGEVPLFFAPVLGINSVAEQAEATAAFLGNFKGFAVPSNGTNLPILPFALDQGTWTALLQGQGTDQWQWDAATQSVRSGHDGVLEADLYPHGTGSPGNRGTVNIRAGNGQNGGGTGNSTQVIKDQIVNGLSAEDLEGFNGRIQLDFNGTMSLNADTGLSGGVEASLSQIKGQPRIIPLFSNVSGNGNNAWYTIVGFAGIRIMDVNLTRSPSNKHVIIQPARVKAIGGIAGGGDQTSQYIFSPVWLVR